ncbi:MAG: divalent metal cation transporter [Planctomycetota bacterium]|nr:divalent metal cation transporter [Planctomycetota bacterium]
MEDSVMESQSTASIKKSKRFGPGLLVAAAFIGPGTVLTASKAGASHGLDLLWCIAFASFGAIVLQLLAARLGILAGVGLGAYLREWLRGTVWALPVLLLVILAVGAGNAFYQAGNLFGAASGLSAVAGGTGPLWVSIIAGLTVALMMIGSYRVLQNVLISLVAFLSLTFLLTACLSPPSLSEIAAGLIPSLDAGKLGTIIALIGTTIVPYNLFLHSSSVAKNWSDCDMQLGLRQARWDTIFAISLGGLVTASILMTASSAFFESEQELKRVQDIAAQLQPVLGNFSVFAFAAGLFAAGFTSSITAPLATSYAVCGVAGWDIREKSGAFRCIAVTVVLIATAFILGLGGAPEETIFIAQFANGLLMPLIAVLLLVAVLRLSSEHEGKNTARFHPLQLAVAAGVVLLICALNCWKLWQLLS